MHKYYNTTIVMKTILILLCVVLAGVIGWTVWEHTHQEPEWDIYYPMANTHIEWTR